MTKRTVVPFKAPERFARVGIDWTRAARTDSERALREAFLTYETSCGPNGQVSVLLLAVVSRRQGTVAEDLQAAADFAEVLLELKLHEHQSKALETAHNVVTCDGAMWSS